MMNAIFHGILMGLVALVVEMLSLSDDGDFSEADYLGSTIGKIDSTGWLRVAVAALVVGIAQYVGRDGYFIEAVNWFALVAVIALQAYYVYWGTRWTNKVREVLALVVLLLVPYSSERLLIRNITSLHGIMVDIAPFTRWVVIGCVLIVAGVAAYRFHLEAAELAKKTVDKPKSAVGKIIAVLLGALLAALVYTDYVDGACVLTPGSAEVIQNNQNGTAQTGDPQSPQTTPGTTSITFYNFMMIGTDEPFNFGPDPTVGGWTAAAYKAELRQRSLNDPALLAAITAYTDAIVHTRFMGVFYDSVAGDWALAINNAKDYWIANPGEFQAAHSSFWSFMDLAEVELEMGDRQCQDLMYMNPYTGTNAPDVIVLSTDQTSGPWLMFLVNIKDNIFEVPFRVPCGFQPSDCQRIMGITPSETPEPTPETTPTPTPETNPPQTETNPPETETETELQTETNPPQTETNPPQTETNPPETETETELQTETNPPQTEKPKKDPSLSSNSGKNDDPGPGPNTNNGVGAQQSAAEKPSNSGNMDSYEQYQEAIEQNKTANDKAQAQQQSGNAPSYTPPANTPSSSSTQPEGEAPSPPKVDNNANTGNEANGGAGVDTPTTEAEKVTPMQDQGEVQQWSGPTD